MLWWKFPFLNDDVVRSLVCASSRKMSCAELYLYWHLSAMAEEQSFVNLIVGGSNIHNHAVPHTRQSVNIWETLWLVKGHKLHSIRCGVGEASLSCLYLHVNRTLVADFGLSWTTPPCFRQREEQCAVPLQQGSVLSTSPPPHIQPPFAIRTGRHI